MAEGKVMAGGAFLLEKTDPQSCFFPEDASEEQRMIYKTTQDFVAGEVMPNMERLEAHDNEFLRDLIRQAGELGLMGAEVPESYGGLGLDKKTTAVLTDAFGAGGSFAVTVGAQTGIGTLPIMYYGNQEQKQKYLPDLAAGAKVSAYCLTESGAGSDAIGGCRTKAVLSEDGKHYILNGEKIFITNGGVADVFIVFAKIDGHDFSAFIVERDFGAISGAEEDKLGIKGSSTTPVILEDVKVPKENLLYEAGKGHHIAMNVLNIGRYKLGCFTVGACKTVLKMAVDYATMRQQFGRSISDFGMIQEKLAKMAVATYLNESANYRAVGMIDDALALIADDSPEYADKATQAIREYAVECAICKVIGSEAIDYLVDENLQIHGGYGYISEFMAERAYRDSRINRIFEGTNEINRLLVPGEILKKALKGRLPLMAAGQKLMGEIMEYSPLMVELPDEPMAYQEHMIGMVKKAVLFVAGVAMQKYMQKLADQQEILGRAADMIIQAFALESGLLRAQKAIAALGEPKAAIYVKLVEAAVDDALPRIHQWANECMACAADGDELRTQLVGLRKLLKYQPLNAISLRREIAGAVITKKGYPLS